MEKLHRLLSQVKLKKKKKDLSVFDLLGYLHGDKDDKGNETAVRFQKFTKIGQKKTAKN